jgi:hypothetical protein
VVALEPKHMLIRSIYLMVMGSLGPETHHDHCETSPLHSLTRIVNRNQLRIQIAPLGRSMGAEEKTGPDLSRPG